MSLTGQQKTDYAAIVTSVASLRATLSSVDPEQVSVSKVLKSFQNEDAVRGKHNKDKG